MHKLCHEEEYPELRKLIKALLLIIAFCFLTATLVGRPGHDQVISETVFGFAIAGIFFLIAIACFRKNDDKKIEFWEGGVARNWPKGFEFLDDQRK